jgi:hypothetical protein
VAQEESLPSKKEQEEHIIGTLRGPQFRGGATMHGPKPRSHAIKLKGRYTVHATLHSSSTFSPAFYFVVVRSILCFILWQQGFTAKNDDESPWYLNLEGVLLSYLFVAKNKKCDVTSQDVSGMSLWDVGRFLCFTCIFQDNEGIWLFQ